MDTDNRAGRRAAAKSAGVKGQLVSVLVTVGTPVSSVTVAGAVVGAIEALAKKGGAPFERAVITIGSDHPEHLGELVVEAKTDRMAKRVDAAAPLALGESLALDTLPPCDCGSVDKNGDDIGEHAPTCPYHLAAIAALGSLTSAGIDVTPDDVADGREF